MVKKQTLICDKCQIEMEELEAEFLYLNKTFRHKVRRCPKCGQIYLSEEIVSGRMKDVEKKLEDK